MRLTIPRFNQAVTKMNRDMDPVNNVPDVSPSMSSNDISPQFSAMMERPQAKKLQRLNSQIVSHTFFCQRSFVESNIIGMNDAVVELSPFFSTQNGQEQITIPGIYYSGRLYPRRTIFLGYHNPPGDVKRLIHQLSVIVRRLKLPVTR